MLAEFGDIYYVGRKPSSKEARGVNSKYGYTKICWHTVGYGSALMGILNGWMCSNNQNIVQSFNTVTDLPIGGLEQLPVPRILFSRDPGFYPLPFSTAPESPFSETSARGLRSFDTGIIRQ